MIDVVIIVLCWFVDGDCVCGFCLVVGGVGVVVVDYDYVVY